MATAAGAGFAKEPAGAGVNSDAPSPGLFEIELVPVPPLAIGRSSEVGRIALTKFACPVWGVPRWTTTATLATITRKIARTEKMRRLEVGSGIANDRGLGSIRNAPEYLEGRPSTKPRLDSPRAISRSSRARPWRDNGTATRYLVHSPHVPCASPVSLTFHCLFMVVSPSQSTRPFRSAAMRVRCEGVVVRCSGRGVIDAVAVSRCIHTQEAVTSTCTPRPRQSRCASVGGMSDGDQLQSARFNAPSSAVASWRCIMSEC